MPAIFTLIEEPLKNSPEFQAVQFLNQGLDIINKYYVHKLGKISEQYYSDIQQYEEMKKQNKIDMSILKKIVGYLKIRNNLVNRSNALHQFLSQKQTPENLEVKNAFAFFEARDLAAIADMLDIVLEGTQKLMFGLANSDAKKDLENNIQDLIEKRRDIIACMKKHLEIFDENSKMQRLTDSQMGFSMMEIQQPNTVKHNLVYLQNSEDDVSLTDISLIKHEMREEFSDDIDPIHKPNEVFFIQYIVKHGTNDDKNWLKTSGRDITKYQSWYEKYTTAVYSLLPDRNSNHYVGLAADGVDALREVAEPLLGVAYNFALSWANLIVRNSGLDEAVKRLEENPHFQAIVKDITGTFTAFLEVVSIPTLSSVKTSVSAPNLHSSDLNSSWANIEDPQLKHAQSAPNLHLEEPKSETPKPVKSSEVTAAEKKFSTFDEAIVNFNQSLTDYLDHINQINRCNALTHAKDKYDFFKTLFGRKTKAHTAVITKIRNFIFSQDMQNFYHKTDDQKISMAANLEEQCRTMIEEGISSIKKENNFFKSELATILENALINADYPWHIEQEDHEDNQQLLMTAKK